MDPELIPMMIFTIIVLGMAGGFILSSPSRVRWGATSSTA